MAKQSLSDRYLTTRTYRAWVDAAGIIRVWDDVAQHYTVCHSLTAGQERYIRARAVAENGAEGVVVICTGCGKRIPKADAHYGDHADTYSGTLWHCDECWAACEMPPIEEA